MWFFVMSETLNVRILCVRRSGNMKHTKWRNCFLCNCYQGHPTKLPAYSSPVQKTWCFDLSTFKIPQSNGLTHSVVRIRACLLYLLSFHFSLSFSGTYCNILCMRIHPENFENFVKLCNLYNTSRFEKIICISHRISRDERIGEHYFLVLFQCL